MGNICIHVSYTLLQECGHRTTSIDLGYEGCRVAVEPHRPDHIDHCHGLYGINGGIIVVAALQFEGCAIKKLVIEGNARRSIDVAAREVAVELWLLGISTHSLIRADKEWRE